MDVSSINPFIESTREVFTTMFQCEPHRGRVRLPSQEDGVCDLTAVIGLTGTVTGAVAFALPGKTAQLLTQKLLMTDQQVADPEVTDAIGEIANMIAGAAKAKMVGQDVSISLPTVIRGHKYVLDHPKGSVTLIVPFDCDLGNFMLNVTFGAVKKVEV